MKYATKKKSVNAFFKAHHIYIYLHIYKEIQLFYLYNFNQTKKKRGNVEREQKKHFIFYL